MNKELRQLNNKQQQTIQLKMGNRPKQTFLKGTHTDSQ